MEAKFKVQTTTSLEDIIALQRVSQAKWGKTVLWIVAIISTVESILLWAWNSEERILLSIVTLLVWAVALFTDRFYGWIFYRGRNRAVKEIGYTFNDEAVLLQHALVESKLDYAAFVKLVEDRKYFFLFVQKHEAHILPKADFTQGDPVDFAAFIAEKTGIEVKRV